MTTALTEPTADPMAAFYAKLEERIRNDVAELLPDDALKALAAKAVDNVFFAKQKVNTGSAYSPHWVDNPSPFEAQVGAAALPMMKEFIVEKLREREADIRKGVDELLDSRYIELRIAEVIAARIDGYISDWINRVRYGV